jgi:hypothetical protein
MWDMDEAYVYRSRTIISLNEVDCTRDVETRPPNRRFTHKGMVRTDMSKPALIFFSCKSTHNKIHCQNSSC